MKLKIDEIIKKQNITYYELCKKTGISNSVFSNIKFGRAKTISLFNAYKIAKALDVKIDDLIEDG